MLSTYVINWRSIDERGIECEGQFEILDCPSEAIALQRFWEAWDDNHTEEWHIDSVEVIDAS